MGSFIYLSFLLAELRSFNCSKKCIICSFLLTSARNLSLLKQFTYMHLKVFITLFQKMIWFIRVWSIKRDADAAEISQNSWTSNPKISETESHSIITRPFRCIYINYFNRLSWDQHKIAKLHLLDNLKTIT